MVIYVDMDGVLAQWDVTATEEDTKRRGFFLSRQPQENVVSLIKELAKLEPVQILSAVYDRFAEEEKIQWLEKFGLGNIPRKFVPYGECKADYVSAPGILIDDYSINLHDWKKSGNKAIKFLNGINGTKGTWSGPVMDYRMESGQMMSVIKEVCS